MSTSAVLAFSSPGWLVLALFLPLLWYLLRVTPPPPASLTFPGFPLLAGLKDADREAAQTPLFLLILRFLLLLLLIIALSGPVYRPMNSLYGNGPMVIVIDNGWTSATNWNNRITAAKSLVTKAANEKRNVVLATTAQTRAGHTPEIIGPSAARSIFAKLDTLAPQPWPTRPQNMASKLLELRKNKAIDGQCPVFWFFDGLAHDTAEIADIMETLQTFGMLTLLYNNGHALEHGVTATGLIENVTREGQNIVATLTRPASLKKLTAPVTLLLKDRKGGVLARHNTVFEQNNSTQTVKMPAMPKLANRAAVLSWSNTATAGHNYMLDNSFARPSTALVLPEGHSGKNLPLLDAGYYIEKAVKPFTSLDKTTLSELQPSSYAVIVAPDMPPQQSDMTQKLTSWVENGGVLVRFAGPSMIAAFVRDPGLYDALLPVRLRLGSRSMGGIMTWNTPAKLDSFAKDTPFAGLSAPDDVLIRTQVLAEPGADLFARTWARLKDGTPLVTAKQSGQGYLVFVHTTANTQWTNLPLSGLFVQLFKRIVHLGRPLATTAATKNGLGELLPIAMLDGFGNLVAPWPEVMPLAVNSSATSAPATQEPANAVLQKDVLHPPGLYGAKQVIKARNLVDFSANLLQTAQTAVPSGVEKAAIDQIRPEKSLADSMFLAALWLFVVELVVSYAMRGLFRRHLGERFNTPGFYSLWLAFFVAASLGMAGPAHAGMSEFLLNQQTIQALGFDQVPPARETPPDKQTQSDVSTPSLGYVVTGHGPTDNISSAGLFALTREVRKRTTAALGKPVAFRLGTDNPDALVLLYWPVVGQVARLSPTAQKDLNRFIQNGGMIVFDTQDQDNHEAGLNKGPHPVLASLSQGLAIPPLIKVPQNHVLSRTFYLLKDGFPGRFTGGDLWLARMAKGRTIENTQQTQTGKQATLGNDNVSPVIVGANNWAGAWATDSANNPLFAVVPGGNAQREIAYRFGVNLVMYALTGNYKSDQVHVNALIERMKH